MKAVARGRCRSIHLRNIMAYVGSVPDTSQRTSSCWARVDCSRRPSPAAQALGRAQLRLQSQLALLAVLGRGRPRARGAARL